MNVFNFSFIYYAYRKSLLEHQAVASQMNKEKQEMEMAIARSMVDQQRLEVEKKSQEELMEQQMKKLAMSPATPGKIDFFQKYWIVSRCVLIYWLIIKS